MTKGSSVFERVDKFPNSAAGERYDALVGLDRVKERLLKEARVLLKPTLLEQWSKRHYGEVLPVVRAFRERIPLFVFAGDVGTGKTALAETFGHPLAKAERIAVTLMRLGLNARGTGRVGEMTSLISEAFGEVEDRVMGQKGASSPTSAVILLVDEADALAQSREIAQMHHEDRAGVNALIRGIDRVSAEGLPVITIMCTNRRSAIDPAVRRRAAAIFEFERPDEEQRTAILGRAFAGTGLSDADLSSLVYLTGSSDGREYGYTYSDLTTRLVPAAVLDAFPNDPLRAERIVQLVAENPPTAPFEEATR
ncbi:MAG: ATP-binding protein [Actinomycetota bacterium]|nr:ATP-binding protein [Actinomycetota bacterium]